MGEIRLACPNCGTKYRLPADAIPETGREVECTGCGHVWLALASANMASTEPEGPDHQHGSPTESAARTDDTDSGSPAPGEIPPLKRRLPDNVLNILREEVEYERRARLGQSITQNLSGGSDLEWPATTVTDPNDIPASRNLPSDLPLEAVEAERRTDPDPRDSSRTAVPIPVAAGAAASPATDMSLPTVQDESQPRRKNGSGYFTGFGLAAAVAAVALALYVMAPGMAGNGSFGKQLMQYRQHVDAGREWLHQRGTALFQRD